jgi:hypothetical protein
MFHKVTGLLPPSSLLAQESLDSGRVKMLPRDPRGRQDDIVGDWGSVKTLAEFERRAEEKTRPFTAEVGLGKKDDEMLD